MIKVFLDSSVIIAGISSTKGASAVILAAGKKKKIQGFVSPIVVKEVIRNLKKKFPHEKLINFLEFLAKSNLKKIEFKNEEEVARFRQITVEKDVHVVAGASKSQVDYLVTLDKKHLLSLTKAALPFKIVTPREFIKTVFR